MNNNQKVIWVLFIIALGVIIYTTNVYTTLLPPYETKISFSGNRGETFIFLSGISVVVAFILHEIFKK